MGGRDELFDHHVKHGAGGKSKHEGHHQEKERNGKGRENAEKRLNSA